MLSEPDVQVSDPRSRALLLSALYSAQEQHGWLSPEAIQQVAEQLDLTPGQVHSTASFYTMFKLQPAGQYVLQVCEGLSCYLLDGADTIIAQIQKRLGITPGETTPDGKFSLQIVQCIAACDYAPAMRVNDDLYRYVTADSLDELLKQLSTQEEGVQNV